jgi:hypothetical protein
LNAASAVTPNIVACDPFESNTAGWMDGETSQRQQ